MRDFNTATRAADGRAIEIIASGLPIFGGAQLAVDVTLRGVLRRDGVARPKAHWDDGVACEAARREKEATYPELAAGSRCRLIVLALETGGRFSAETADFLQQLAGAKALTVPAYLRRSAAVGYQRRWARMLAVCAASSFVESLLVGKECLVALDRGPSREPWLHDVLTGARHEGDDDPAADLGADLGAAGDAAACDGAPARD